MNDIQRQISILHQLVKAEAAVKRKYDLIKHEKDSFEEAIKGTFKPIIDPLQKLVTNAKKRNHPIKAFKKKILTQDEAKHEETNGDLEETLIRDVSGESSLSSNDATPVYDTDFETAASDDEEDSTDLSILKNQNEVNSTDKYMDILKSPKDVDKIYGVRKEGEIWMLGNSSISFGDESIQVKELTYPKTAGLVELLVAKHPDQKIFGKTDLQNYKSILEATSAHKKGFRSNESIRIHNSKKYTDIINPLFAQKGGEGLPQYKIARKDTQMDYVYWDDPNELVDRLRLLIAEQSAGNPSHINEIHSIIEELCEAGYIH